MIQTDPLHGVRTTTDESLMGFDKPDCGSIADRKRRRLRVLIYTTLFPNSVQPLHGNFILERMRHLQDFVDMSVIAPVPYFPKIKLNERWFEFATVPHTEQFAGFTVDHPRYVVLPKIGM